MKQLSIILGVLFLGMNANAQNTEVQGDTTRLLDEVKIIGIAKRKIETEMKMDGFGR